MRMEMNETLTLVLACVAGGVLGAMFFGGLWWTVRNGMSFRQPALLFLGSLLLRTGLVLTGFYFVSGGHLDRLLMCLPGFVISRFIVTRFAGSPVPHHTAPSQEPSHAP
jgi:F1F0 ATPase subunit 2